MLYGLGIALGVVGLLPGSCYLLTPPLAEEIILIILMHPHQAARASLRSLRVVLT